MHLMDEKLRIDGNLNVRGILGMLIQPFRMTVCLTPSTIERIVFHAQLQDHFKEGQKKLGIQEKLEDLAERSDFKNILQNEVDKQKLVYADAWRCVNKICRKASKHADRNNMPILLERCYFTVPELVELISFLRLQEKWSGRLLREWYWREV